jgi:hypothetical protein
MGKGFGRIEKRRQQLEARKDKLRDLDEMVPWEVLRQVLDQLPRKERKSNAGPHIPPFSLAHSELTAIFNTASSTVGRRSQKTGEFDGDRR